MTTLTQYYTLQNRENYSLLTFSGDLDAATVESIRPSLQPQIPEKCSAIILDLQRVSFIDSHGVGLFVSLLKRVHRNGGKLYITSAIGQPAAVLRMVGLDNDLVTYCPSRDAAIERLATRMI